MRKYDDLIRELIRLPSETEWVEFKHSNDNPDEIGEYISALSNSATYVDRDSAYVVWGIDNETHDIVGTTFDYKNKKVGNEELENWLRRSLSNNANFSFHGVEVDNKALVLLIIYRATHRTVRFKNVDYIRVGSYKKPLKSVQSIEARLWGKLQFANFESSHAKEGLDSQDILGFLDYQAYFHLTGIPMPIELEGIMHYLQEDKLIIKQDNALYAISNLGAVLFAKKLKSFDSISRKRVRVIQYSGTNRVNSIDEAFGSRGYASSFEKLLLYIQRRLPTSETIENGIRKNVSAYPEIAVREVVANALIHQDMSITGAGPTIEIFSNRIEVTNPGAPIVDYMRFIDNPPRSRNESLASFMRRIGICEERGSGWDKIAWSCEVARLPAPKIDIYDEHTKITLYSYVPFTNISQEEKMWACYTHACLKYVEGEQLTNSSLRNRFGVSESNKSAISRLIKAAMDKGLIKLFNPAEAAPRYKCYVPIWA